VAQPGEQVSVGSRVTLDGHAVDWQALQAELLAEDSSPTFSLALEERFTYLAYHKPRGVTCTTDERIRGNLLDALRLGARRSSPQLPERLFSIGRLDKESTGLLLVTNDGRLPNALLRASAGKRKLYRVTADGPVSDGDVRRLAQGVVITTVAQRDGRAAPPLTAATLPCDVQRHGTDGRSLLIILKEGRNRQIRKMLEACGYETVDLHRLEFAGIGLGGLTPGSWRVLDEKEMALIRTAVTERDASSKRIDHTS
jgi:pseudouridine synthase